MSTLLTASLCLLWSLIIYHHLVYPLVLRFLRYIHREPTHIKQLPDELLPYITILVPAFNEADVIADKIRNVASLDYPSHKLTMIIACDGCTDNTSDTAMRTAAEPENRSLNLAIAIFPTNRGKVAILNDMVPKISSGLVALSDASALISMDGLRVAASHLSDSRVGVVAATYRIFNPGSDGEATYWRYQVGVKEGEAAIGAPLGVHGALYFFHHRLFHPLDDDTINDDFLLPMNIVAKGYRAIYEPRIVALELEQATLEMDQTRRRRIAAGNFQQLIRLPQLLHPRYKGTAFSFFSGKALRAIMPLILLTQLLLCTLLAFESEIIFLLTFVQIITIILSSLSRKNENQLPRLINVLAYLINGYISSLMGILRYMTGLEKGNWKPVNHKETES